MAVLTVTFCITVLSWLEKRRKNEEDDIGVGTNGAGGAIAPPLFYRKKETHLLTL